MSPLLVGMKKIRDNEYIIGYDDWGNPVTVWREKMVSELMYVGCSKERAEELIRELDNEYDSRKDV